MSDEFIMHMPSDIRGGRGRIGDEELLASIPGESVIEALKACRRWPDELVLREARVRIRALRRTATRAMDARERDDAGEVFALLGQLSNLIGSLDAIVTETYDNHETSDSEIYGDP